MTAKIIPLRPAVVLGDGWIGFKPGDDYRLPDKNADLCLVTQSSYACTCEKCRPDLPPIWRAK